MIATADHFGTVADCRTLVLEGKFFRLSEQDVHMLAQQFFTFADGLPDGESVRLWKCRNRVLRSADEIAGLKIRLNEIFDITMYGDIKSLLVYDKRSLRAYDRRLLYDPVYTLGLAPVNASCDYPGYTEIELDPYRGDPQEFRKALLKLFAQDGRKNRELLCRHDMEGGILASAIEGQDGLFSGDFSLQISCLSLGDALDAMAEALYAFGVRLASKFTNINMTVAIEQTPHDWARYFGALNTGNADINTGSLLCRRAKYLYLDRVGWGNIISPLLCSLLPDNGHAPAEILANGAACIRLKRPVSQTSLEDLKQIKAAVYPAMLPAKTVFDTNWPYYRSHWENVAVLNDEVQVENGQVIFVQNGEADRAYLLGQVVC